MYHYKEFSWFISALFYSYCKVLVWIYWVAPILWVCYSGYFCGCLLFDGLMFSIWEWNLYSFNNLQTLNLVFILGLNWYIMLMYSFCFRIIWLDSSFWMKFSCHGLAFEWVLDFIFYLVCINFLTYCFLYLPLCFIILLQWS